MPSQPDVSVILSTYNRADLLPRALEALLAQLPDSPTYEILVVDNNSTDETAEIIESFCERSPVVQHLFEARQGVSYAHNTGVRHAQSDILAFTDDDLIPANDWVRSVKRAFDLNPDIDFLGGRVLALWNEAPSGWLTRAHWA